MRIPAISLNTAKNKKEALISRHLRYFQSFYFLPQTGIEFPHKYGLFLMICYLYVTYPYYPRRNSQRNV